MSSIKPSAILLLLATVLTGCARSPLTQNIGKLVSLDAGSQCLGVDLNRGITLGVTQVCSPDANPVDETTGWVFVANPIRGCQILVALIGSKNSELEVVMADKKVYRSRTDQRGFFSIRIAGAKPILYFSVKGGRYSGQRCRPEAGYPNCASTSLTTNSQ